MPRLGKRHIELASQWLSSAITFGAAGGIVFCYATEWKAVLQYIPYYNGKYKQEE